MRLISVLRQSLFAGLVLLTVSCPSDAHNGAVAIAIPVDGIAVDGDLSDWPAETPSHPIATVVRVRGPLTTGDLKASFRVGFSAEEQALYIGIAVVDESAVVGDSSANGSSSLPTAELCVWLGTNGAGVSRYDGAGFGCDIVDEGAT